MVTALVDDLVSISKINEAGKRAGIEIRILSPQNADANDDFYLVDYVHQYAISAVRMIRDTKPDAKIIGFYPHVRFYIKDEMESIGCRALTNAEFFSKVNDIVKGKI